MGDQPAKPAEENREPGPRKGLLRDYVETILICVIFVIFSRAFVFQQSKIPSGSMMDTLLVGDYIMVNRFVYAPTSFAWERALLPERRLEHGDVVVFKFPEEPEVDYIKRVVGLPGDVVEGRDYALYVNGERLEEPYVSEIVRRVGNYDFGPIVVEPDHYFMMGDNRAHSEDSRRWGQVPRDLIKGRALLIWWSYDEEETYNGYMSTSQRLRSWGDKVLHFFTRSRWGRCFQLIR